ncbi:MAG: hypothetical protein GY926_13335 [bacterium]|nr:hypothetical protein [bacterium]
MTAHDHWLQGTSFLSLLHEAVQGAERLLADRMDQRGEIERQEDVLTTVLVEELQRRLETVNGAIRDLSGSREGHPSVSKFDFSVCDMRDPKGDALGADIAFILRVRWDREFTSERGILIQAKRLGPLSDRTLRRIDSETQRQFGITSAEMEDYLLHMFPVPIRPPSLRRARHPWLFWLGSIGNAGNGAALGDFRIDKKQLDELVRSAVSSYYLFFDHPVPHLTLPCVQAHTVAGLASAVQGNHIGRLSVLRHATSLTGLLVDEFVGCRIGEWNQQFQQLAEIADQNRIGRLDTPRGDFNVHVWNVRYVVTMEVSLIPISNYGEDRR